MSCLADRSRTFIAASGFTLSQAGVDWSGINLNTCAALGFACSRDAGRLCFWTWNADQVIQSFPSAAARFTTNQAIRSWDFGESG
jgi:hypothetical protein